jgi:amino acid permease
MFAACSSFSSSLTTSSQLKVSSKVFSKNPYRLITLQMDAHSEAKNADPPHCKSFPDDFGGTVADQRGMAELGLKQQTQRYFKPFTMTMFGCAIIATGQVIITSSHLVVDSVGTAGLFWGFVLVAVVFAVVYTSIAEMSSIVSLGVIRRRSLLS